MIVDRWFDNKGNAPGAALSRSEIKSRVQQMSFPGRAVQRTWHLIDATDQTVGRLATAIAPLLKGKHKPTYRPNGDCGDYVVVINADQVSFVLFSPSGI